MIGTIFCTVVLLVVIGAVVCTTQPTLPSSHKQTAIPTQHQRSTINATPLDLSLGSHAVVRTRHSRNVQKPSGSPIPGETARYRRLLSMALGDHKLAERLIRYEALQAPHDCRAALIQSAIDRWVRDHNQW